jgi:hypothetical protein
MLAQDRLAKTGHACQIFTSRYSTAQTLLSMQVSLSISVSEFFNLSSVFRSKLQCTPSLILFLQSNFTVLRGGAYGG